MKTGYYEAVGAVHMHSTYSDGSRPIPEIAAIAGRKNLDFLMFTDHNTLEPKRQGLEGWYDKVLVLIGYEINDSDDRNHYLAFRLDKEVEPDLPALEYVRRVKENGGFGVIAHPAEKRDFSDAYPPYPWTAWNTDAFDGIEIWNQLSEWIEGVTRINIAYRIVHPLRSIRFPEWETLQRWDTLNLQRRVVGVGGIDVHAYQLKILGLIPLTIYPYKVQFRSIRTHILTERPIFKENNPIAFSSAEVLLFDALARGRCFISNYSLGDARGFVFTAENDEKTLHMGSRTSGGRWRFMIKAPLPGTIRMMRDGQVVRQMRSSRLDMEADRPGVYRVEIFRKKRGWIYSNPIVILKG